MTSGKTLSRGKRGSPSIAQQNPRASNVQEQPLKKSFRRVQVPNHVHYLPTVPNARDLEFRSQRATPAMHLVPTKTFNDAILNRSPESHRPHPRYASNCSTESGKSLGRTARFSQKRWCGSRYLIRTGTDVNDATVEPVAEVAGCGVLTFQRRIAEGVLLWEKL
ncbi:hypothetical protein PMIN06_011337 [Paraphaeosphaeria minitans]